MDTQEFLQELKLNNKAVAITRVTVTEAQEKIRKGCTLALLQKVMDGESVLVTADNVGCGGAKAGFGLCDGLPDTPGGIGYFLSYGRGEGYPPGERIKRNPDLGEQLLLNQPQDVMAGHNALKLEALVSADGSDIEDFDLVTFLTTPDQLSALIHIFNFDKVAYDTVIVPMTSGCASVFRIPFAESEKGSNARAVIGNVDIFSRVHFPADTFFFTISAECFKAMLADSDESILVSPIWKAMRKRIHEDS